MEAGQLNVGVTHCQAEAETGDSAAGAARQQVPLLMTKQPDSSLIQMLLSKHHLGTPPAPLHAPFAPLAGDSALCNFSA